MSTDLRQLSEREIEILRLVAGGLSNQQIANALGLSINTVKVHLRNVFAKIGAASRTEATMYAVRAGIVAVERPGLPAAAEALPLPDDVAPQADDLTLDGAQGEIRDDAVEPVPQSLPELRPEPAARTSPILTDPLSEPPPVTAIASSSVPTTGDQDQLMERPGVVRIPRRRWLLAVATLIVLLGLGGATWWSMRDASGGAAAQAVQEADQARWRALADMPTPRAAFAVAALGDLLYVIGGENETGVLDSVERFDARFGTWTELTRKPTPVTDIRAVVLGGKIYVPGGRLARDPAGISDVFERYDPQAEHWEELPKLPAPRSGYALTTLEGKLYLFGGWDGTRYSGDVFEFDPERGSWEERSSMPTARAYADAVVVGENVYVLGGENETGPLASNEVYTPFREGTQPWVRRAPLPQPRSRFGSAVALSVIHVIGGATNVPPAKYNVRTDSWQAFADPPKAIGAQPGVVLLDAEVIGLGGTVDQQGYSTDMQAYQALFSVMLPLQ